MEAAQVQSIFRRRRLPHWQVKDGRYFITLCVVGAIPDEAMERIRALHAEMEKLQPSKRITLKRRIFRLIEDYLDRNSAFRELVRPAVARMLMEAILFRHRKKIWSVVEYVIMPNHIHFFVEIPLGQLETAMDRFKHWTAVQANRLLERNGQQFWHREWFDHWSRSSDEDRRIIEYIRKNPVKAGLVQKYRDWPFASWAEPALAEKE